MKMFIIVLFTILYNLSNLNIQHRQQGRVEIKAMVMQQAGTWVMHPYKGQ